MLRRILFILVLLGLGFIVWRMINPSAANNAVESLQELPSKIFSKDKDDVETTLLIDMEDSVEESEDTIPDAEEQEDVQVDAQEDDLGSDLFAETEDELFADEDEEDEIITDEKEDEKVVEKEDSKDLEEDKEQEDTQKESEVEETKDIEEVQTPKPGSSDCRVEGEVAMAGDGSTCCAGLNWVYYRGTQSNAGAICFDPSKGVPSCKDEGWYFMDGSLLKKDLDCSTYFGDIEYVEDTDANQTESILKNLFK